MKLAAAFLLEPIEIKSGETVCLIIENQKLFREFVEDIRRQLNREEGSVVFSRDNITIMAAKEVMMLENFAPFNINSKDMLHRISDALEKIATEEYYLETAEILANIERYFENISEMEYNIKLSKLTIGNLTKAMGPVLVEDYRTPLEAVIDYMDYITGFDGDKLFVTVNLRNYFLDEEILPFVKTVEGKNLKILMLESTEGAPIKGINQTIIDKDLCHI